MAVAVAAAVAVVVAAAVAVAVVVIAVAVAVAITTISTMSFFFFQAIISSHTTVIFCSPYARYGIRALARDCSADDGARGD